MLQRNPSYTVPTAKLSVYLPKTVQNRKQIVLSSLVEHGWIPSSIPKVKVWRSGEPALQQTCSTARSDRLLTSQCSWCFIHIKLTGEEAQEWKGMPVINNRELGYLFEPDIEGRRLKIAPHGVGYTHYMTPGGKSHPRSKTSNPTDGIPSEDKERVRELLRMALPTLAERPFEYERMCWDAE